MSQVVIQFSWPIRTGCREACITSTDSNVLYDLSLYFEDQYKDKLGPVIYTDFDEDGNVRVFFPEGLLSVNVSIEGKRGRKPHRAIT